MNKDVILNDESIKNKIHYLREKYVILDKDIAGLYGIQTGRLNEQVKRNNERFPKDFCFQLNNIEFENLNLMSQFAISSWGGVRKLPFVFTEQGVAMLSSVLKSKKAIEVNIKIIRTFILMRKYLAKNKEVFYRLDNIEKKQIEYDKSFDRVFDALSLNEPKQGVFFNGQIFDAFKFIFDLVKKAKKKIVLIDNYIDETTLYFFTKTDVNVLILSNFKAEKEIEKYNQQYKNVEIRFFNKSHDRFLIIDDEVYLTGASLKDAGKKIFGFFKLEDKDSINRIKSLIL